MITRRQLLPVIGFVPVWRAFDTSVVPRPPRTRLLAGGDVMLARWIGEQAALRKDPAWALRDLAPVLAAADLAFVNLESPFSDQGKIGPSRMIFKAEPPAIEALKLAGVDVASTANNHARDCGSRGVEFTLAWLARHGISAVGSGATGDAARAGAMLERNGVKFGFLAYTYDQSNGNWKDHDERIAGLDIASMREDVRRLAKHANVVIVSMHAGIEYQLKASPAQISFARAAIDAGAKVVLGHHPHVVQPWERYKGGAIFYSLGNLVFDQFQRAETQRGALAEVIFEGPVVKEARMLPVEIARGAPRLKKSVPGA